MRRVLATQHALAKERASIQQEQARVEKLVFDAVADVRTLLRRAQTAIIGAATWARVETKFRRAWHESDMTHKVRHRRRHTCPLCRLNMIGLLAKLARAKQRNLRRIQRRIGV